jgi:hypothetical protein
MEKIYPKRSSTSIINKQIAPNIYKSRPQSSSSRGVILEENKKLKQRIKNLEKMLSVPSTYTNSSALLEPSPDTLIKTNKSKNYTNSIIKDVDPDGNKRYISRLKETVSVMKQEIKNLQEENLSLKQYIASNAQYNKVTLIVWNIYRACVILKIDVEELWYVFNPNLKEFIGVEEFKRGVRGIGLDFSDKKIEYLFYLFTEGGNCITQTVLGTKLELHKPALAVKIQEIQKPLEYLSIALSSNCITFELLESMVLTQSKYTYQEFESFLKINFSGIGSPSMEKICRSIYANNLAMESKAILVCLKKLLDRIEIITDEEEFIYKSQLQEFMKTKGMDFLLLCERSDTNFTGNIPYRNLVDVLTSLGLAFNEKLEFYIKCLCYRNSNIVEVAPFTYLYTFLKA